MPHLGQQARLPFLLTPLPPTRTAWGLCHSAPQWAVPQTGAIFANSNLLCLVRRCRARLKRKAAEAESGRSGKRLKRKAAEAESG